MGSPHAATVSPLPPVTAELRARALILAARSGCDYRTALRVLQEGAHVIRRVVLRDAVVRALESLEHEGRPHLVSVR